MCIACSGLPSAFGRPSPTRRLFVSSGIAAAGVYATARGAAPSPAAAQGTGTSTGTGTSIGTSTGTGTGTGADLIIENAKIITLDPARPTADAVAIGGDRILRVGTRRDLQDLVGPGTQVIDAGGRTLVPGLNDSHTHFIRGGLTYAQELRWDGVPSLSIALQMLRDQAHRTPAPNWVQVVGGWTGGQFAEKRLPTLDEINAATGDVPAFVMHIYDRAFINRAGLRVLGFNRDTPNPFGGTLGRDEDGNPTGLVVNVANIGALLGIFARVPKLPDADQVISTRHFMRELNRLGITSVIDAGGGGQNYPDNYAAIAKLAADRALTVRIGYSLFAQRPGKELDDYRRWVGEVKAGQGDDYFRMVGAGEYMIWAAHDPANFAKDVVPPPPGTEDQLVEAIKLVVAHDWPFRLHANYDVTVQGLLGAIERAHADVPVTGVRWVIDHAETISPQSLERVAKLGGSIAVQNRMTLDGDAFVAKWGAAPAADAPPIGRIREMGIPLAAGTDGNRATSHNPWVGVQWLITGQSISGAALNAPRNRLDRTEALRLYSQNGAWLTREEDKKGTIAAGKWADLALLSDDYLAIPVERISSITSVLTMVGGRVVYGAGSYGHLAPAALPVSPDWLPIGTYPSYTTAAVMDGGVQLAQDLVAEHGPLTITGSAATTSGAPWSLGCLCGLL